MTRRRSKLIWLLLPLLALRGLVPAGFMVDTAHGHLAIVVCPGHIPAAQDSEPGTGHDQPSKLCPFAVAAVSAPPGFEAAIASFVSLSLENLATPAVLETGLTVTRAHPIRGPPALS